MKKAKMKVLSVALAALLVGSALAGCGGEAEESSSASNSETSSVSEEASTSDSSSESSSESETTGENPNSADFTVYDENFDMNTYYNDVGVECDNSYTGTLGAVSVPDDYTTEMPKANEEYTIGFSIYYTVDEVGAMDVEYMEQFAEEAGVKLLINDANYDQNAQNQAIEQWIVEGVDGVILAPCDFYGVKASLDALNEAGIPVVTLNPALNGEALCAVMLECYEEGEMAAEMLVDYLEENGSDMKGTVIYQTLPFTHPNAILRADGFKAVMADYPDINIVELSGNSPEEHYTAFEGALQGYDDLIGAYGIYSSATVGMLNAREASGSDLPIVSIDNDRVIMEAVKTGDCIGTVGYSSKTVTFFCMSQLINYLNGYEIPSVIFYENTKITEDNVDEMFPVYYMGDSLEDYMSGATT